MAAAQDKAETMLKAHNVRLVTLPPEELAAQRDRMMPQQDKIAREMKISPDMLDRVTEAVASG
jgi:hypothetical protein